MSFRKFSEPNNTDSRPLVFTLGQLPNHPFKADWARRRLDLWAADLWPPPKDWADDLLTEPLREESDLSTRLRHVRERGVSRAKSL